MKLVTFVKNGADRLGAIKASGVVDLLEAYEIIFPRGNAEQKAMLIDMISFLCGGEKARPLVSQLLRETAVRALPLESVQLRPPGSKPFKDSLYPGELKNSQRRRQVPRTRGTDFFQQVFKLPRCFGWLDCHSQDLTHGRKRNRAGPGHRQRRQIHQPGECHGLRGGL
jgi:hypothetical protein